MSFRSVLWVRFENKASKLKRLLRSRLLIGIGIFYIVVVLAIMQISSLRSDIQTQTSRRQAEETVRDNTNHQHSKNVDDNSLKILYRQNLHQFEKMKHHQAAYDEPPALLVDEILNKERTHDYKDHVMMSSNKTNLGDQRSSWLLQLKESNSVLIRKLKETKQKMSVTRMRIADADTTSLTFDDDNEHVFFSRKSPRKMPPMLAQTSESVNDEVTAFGVISMEIPGDDSKYSTVAEMQAVPFYKLNDDFFVYSAYLDSRFSISSQNDLHHEQVLDKSQALRILMLGPSEDKDSFKWTADCLIKGVEIEENRISSQMRGTMKRFPAIRVEAHKYHMCENHGKQYGGWILSCPVPEYVTLPLIGNVTIALSITTLADLDEQVDDIKQKVITDVEKLIPYRKICGKLKTSQNEANSNSKWTGREIVYSNGMSVRQKKIPNNKNVNSDSNINIDKMYSKNKEKTQSTIGVCVPPLYGDVDLTRIANFVEMVRILGATSVFLYVNDISWDMRRILFDYTLADPSFLHLVDWRPPVLTRNPSDGNNHRNGGISANSMPDSKNSNNNDDDGSDIPFPLPFSEIIWNRGQLLAIQHCLYDNMDAFDWLLFLDIDEMLFPRNASTWHELFEQIIQSRTAKYAHAPHNTSFSQNANNVHSLPHIHEQNNGNSNNNNNNKNNTTIAGFSFQSAVFYASPETQAQYNVEYFQNTIRPKQADSLRTKLAVRPQMIFELGIHHLSKAFTTTTTTTNNNMGRRGRDEVIMIPVPHSTALVHHYRQSDTSWQEEYFNMDENVVHDQSAIRFEARLSDATQSLMRNLNKMVKKRGL